MSRISLPDRLVPAPLSLPVLPADEEELLPEPAPIDALRSTNWPPVDPDPLADPADPEAVLPVDPEAVLPVDPEPVLPDAVLPLLVEPEPVPAPMLLPLPRCRQPVTVTSPPCI